MTDCTQESFEFPPVKRRKVEATFSGGEISSDGGVVLLREADRHLVSMANNFDPLSANKIDPLGATKISARVCASVDSSLLPA